MMEYGLEIHFSSKEFAFVKHENIVRLISVDKGSRIFYFIIPVERCRLTFSISSIGAVFVIKNLQKLANLFFSEKCCSELEL